jgi:cysteine-rich repeat protein
MGWTSPSAGIVGQDVVELAVAPDNASVAYAAVTTGGGKVLKTTNGESSWSSSGLPTANVHALAFGPSDASTIYVGTDLGLYKTTNAGNSFALTALADLYPNASVQGVVVDPANYSNVYATVPCGGVYLSTDAGSSWTQFNAGLSDQCVYDLAIDPQQPARLYATGSGQVLKVTDCGDNLLDPVEGCDDGNTADGDGCDSNCSPTASGNGIRTAGEVCDGSDVGDISCRSLGFLGYGQPSCTTECAFDTSNCGPTKAEANCRKEIRKQFADYFKAKLRALQTCIDGVNRGTVTGPCPDAKATTKITKAASKISKKITTKCGGDLILSLTLPCPDVISPTDVSACIVDKAGGAVDAALA